MAIEELDSDEQVSPLPEGEAEGSARADTRATRPRKGSSPAQEKAPRKEAPGRSASKKKRGGRTAASKKGSKVKAAASARDAAPTDATRKTAVPDETRKTAAPDAAREAAPTSAARKTAAPDETRKTAAPDAAREAAPTGTPIGAAGAPGPELGPAGTSAGTGRAQPGGSLPQSTGADEARSDGSDGSDGAAAEASRKRKLRVADYAARGERLPSREDLDGVANLARELAQLSTPETRGRLLAEAVAHAEAKEARYRVPLAEPGVAARWKAPLALVTFLVAALTAVSPPGWAVPDPPAQLDVEDRLRGTRVTLLLQAQQVEAFRARERRLPDALEEVSVHLDGVRFIKSSSRVYQLVAYGPDGEAVVYDAADPAPAFERAGAAWALGSEAR